MAWTDEYHALTYYLGTSPETYTHLTGGYHGDKHGKELSRQLLLLFFEVHHWFQVCLNFRSFLAMLPRNFYEDQKIKANRHEDRITLEST